MQKYGQIWRYAVAIGKAERDITQDLKGALKSHKARHFVAITEPKEVAALMRAINGYTGTYPVACALKLSALLFQRPGEMRAMKWAEVDLQAREWRYLVTKTNTLHTVPLCRQAVEIMESLKPLTGHGVRLFPSERNTNITELGRCMSENSVNGALRRLGYGKETMCAHGFRALANIAETFKPTADADISAALSLHKLSKSTAFKRAMAANLEQIGIDPTATRIKKIIDEVMPILLI